MRYGPTQPAPKVGHGQKGGRKAPTAPLAPDVMRPSDRRAVAAQRRRASRVGASVVGSGTGSPDVTGMAQIQAQRRDLYQRTQANLQRFNEAPPTGSFPGDLLHGADVGVGAVIGTRPSDMPGNIYHNALSLVPGTKDYHKAQTSTTPSIGVVPWGPLGRAPKGLIGRLDAAALEHKWTLGADATKAEAQASLKAVAKKYNVPAKRLGRHVEAKGAELQQRILSNQDPNRVMPHGMSPEVQASADKITAGLSDARSLRTQQERLYSIERGKRAGAAEQAMVQTGGVEGLYAGLHELKGELPKLSFAALKNRFGEKEVTDLFNHIQNLETLRPFEKIRAQTALLKAFGGNVPTYSEMEILHELFGPKFAQEIYDSVPMLEKIRNAGLEIANIPRSLLASFDVSAPFRQGLVAGAAHPVMFARNFVPMFKALGSEGAYHAIMDQIVSRPTYDLMQKGGLSLTELGDMTKREEQFVSNYAEHLPGGKVALPYNKTIGAGVRASGRAYTGFLSKMRADMFDYLLEKAKSEGVPVEEDKFLKSLATYINSATGRGDLGHFQGAAVYLNSIFFSPRLLASRLNFLNPFYYARLDPFVRKEALKAVRNLIGVVGATLFLAKMAGAQVSEDPLNADWAKIKIGNTRIDVLGGFQQPVRLVAQLAAGKIISSTTGDPLSLGPGYGHLTRRDIILRFLEGKFTPTVSFVDDWLKGTNFQDQPFNIKREAIQRVIPLMIQDAADLYHSRGLGAAVGGYAIGSFGVGFQTYGPKDQAKKAQTQLEKDSKDAGMGLPPAKVLEDLRWKTTTDKAVGAIKSNDPQKWMKRATVVLKIFDERYGTNYSAQAQYLRTEGQAEEKYHQLRPLLYSRYEAWSLRVRQILEREHAMQPTGTP